MRPGPAPLVAADGAQPGRLLIGRQVAEAQALVVWAVPGHLDERRERDGREALRTRPRCPALDQRPADAPAGVVGVHGHLLDVGGAVDDVEQEVAGRAVVRVDRDEGPAGVGERLELLDRAGSLSATRSMPTDRNVSPAGARSRRGAGDRRRAPRGCSSVLAAGRQELSSPSRMRSSPNRNSSSWRVVSWSAIRRCRRPGWTGRGPPSRPRSRPRGGTRASPRRAAGSRRRDRPGVQQPDRPAMAVECVTRRDGALPHLLAPVLPR